MIDRKFSSTDGFSTLSLLVALAICAGIAIAASTSVFNLLRTLAAARFERSTTTRILTMDALLESVMHDLDSSTLAISARVHSAGRISASDGSLNAITSRNDALAPMPSSDAITAYSLLTSQTLDIEQIDQLGSSFRACSRYGERLSIDPLRTVIGVSAHANWEFKVLSKQPRRAAKCVTLRLAPTPSMILPSANLTDLPWIRTIIPVRRVYTFYLDRNETLRYLGHSGTTNIENQPVLTQLKALNLSLTLSPDGLFALNAIIENERRSAHALLATSQLARRPHLFTLLARP